MTTPFSILAWKIPWTEAPGRLQSMWSQSQTPLSTHAQHTYGKTHISQVYTLDSHKLNIHMYSTHRKKKKRDFPRGPVVKNLLANSGDTGSIPDPGRPRPPRSH